MAFALLTLVFVGVMSLFENSLVYSRRAERLALGAQLARNEIARVRQWASHENDDNWENLESHVNGVVLTPDPDRPDVTVRLQAAMQPIDSPNSALETGQADPRTLRASYKKLDAYVQAGSDRFVLTTLVGVPRRNWRLHDPIEVDPSASANLGAGETKTYTARGVDTRDRTIPDLFFHWSVRPITGVGLIQSHKRDGSQATFVNQARGADGHTFQTGGRCVVAAWARYRGEEQFGLSGEITLGGGPP